MPYDSSTSYAKYQSCNCGAESESDCSCGNFNSDCSCCPVGTVGVYNEDGDHVGCLSPNDAEIFQNGTHVPTEGFIKVINPSTGAYYGDLPPSQAIQYLDFIINGTTTGAAAATFNVVNPEVGVTGFFEMSYAYNLGDGISDVIPLVLDRIGLTDAVTVSIQNSVENIQFSPSGTVTSIPLGDSDLDVQITWTAVGSPGSYTFILRFATTTITKEVPVRLTLV